MSSQLHAEMIRARQQEIAARAANAHHRYELDAAAGRSPRGGRSGVRRLAAATAATAGLCLAVTTATGTTATRESATGGQARTEAVHLQSRVEQLDAKGYVERSCTRDGIVMINRRTGHSSTVLYYQ